jgi:hypothetical protein
MQNGILRSDDGGLLNLGWFICNEKPKRIRPTDVNVENGARDLVRSPDMKPYLNLAREVMADKDATEMVARIAELPLERRYIWRVASELKWAFADFDDLNVTVDRDTLRAEDLWKIVELLKYLPIQLAMLCEFSAAVHKSEPAAFVPSQ